MNASAWPPHILIHTLAAGAALLIGLLQLAGAKGTLTHRRLGWTWVALMLVVAGSSLLMRDTGMVNLAGFTPIHLFTLLTLVLLPVAVHRASRHDRAGHARAMTGLISGALVIAGLFTLAPGRRLGTLLWSALGLTG
ncbi:MAG: DUF2306 domain-containing protein [Burkholderiaceae bacterium]|nr:DUF2306 domain-containing protein [Burkholderiaceae bacterium]